MIRDRDTGLGKGFGYVNFLDKASVELALKKDGDDFNNRPLRISRCVKKLKTTGDNKFNNNNIQRKGSKSFKFPPPPPGHKSEQRQERNNSRDSKRNVKKISQGMRQRKDVFAGDRTAEVGKFKVCYITKTILKLTNLNFERVLCFL